MVKIFDSMSKTKKNLTANNIVNLYLCGPTVYNYIHIGNIRPVLIIDVLHRLLDHQKYQVYYVHNITDIDDKIIMQAQKEQITETALTEKYLQAYLEDLKMLNVLMPTKLPKVSDFIAQNITFIETLLKKEAAYLADGDVYFKFAKIPSYGTLANKKPEQLIANFRTKSTNKVSPFDFALWKKTDHGLNWKSPWTDGRPGWHTECVVFIKEFFHGQPIDFHGGGIDLIFPHHENERAQFLAATNQELANIWWHNGHINLASKKMSKSLNNIILVKDFCQKYHPFVLRYLILNHDHQQPIDFTNELIIEANSTIKKYHSVLQWWSYYLFINEIKMQKDQYDQNYYQKIIDYLNDNLSTTNVFTFISKMIKDLYQAINGKNFTVEKQNLFHTLVFSLEILGFNFEFGNYSEAIQTKIKIWEKLKSEKNFQAADEIRIELQNLAVLPKN